MLGVIERCLNTQYIAASYRPIRVPMLTPSSAEGAYSGHTSIKTGPWRMETWSEESCCVQSGVCITYLRKRWHQDTLWDEDKQVEAKSEPEMVWGARQRVWGAGLASRFTRCQTRQASMEHVNKLDDLKDLLRTCWCQILQHTFRALFNEILLECKYVIVSANIVIIRIFQSVLPYKIRQNTSFVCR